MVKVFTNNKNGKIEFTKKELENLLNEVWIDGYNASTNGHWWFSPTCITTSTNGSTITYATNMEREGE